jgi:hypothetical protein
MTTEYRPLAGNDEFVRSSQLLCNTKVHHRHLPMSWMKWVNNSTPTKLFALPSMNGYPMSCLTLRHFDYKFLLSHVGLTTDVVLDSRLDLLATYRSQLQITITLSLISTLYKSLHLKSSPVCSVFTRRFLVTDFNSGGSSASRAQVLSSQTPVQIWLDRLSYLLYNSSTRTA